MSAPYSVPQLQDAARRSITKDPDPNTGRREGDPLPVMITAANASAHRVTIELATGRKLYAVPRSNEAYAALLRSQLRRWAHSEGMSA